MTISGGTFTISGAPQNRFPIKYYFIKKKSIFLILIYLIFYSYIICPISVYIHNNLIFGRTKTNLLQSMSINHLKLSDASSFHSIKIFLLFLAPFFFASPTFCDFKRWCESSLLTILNGIDHLLLLCWIIAFN